MIHVLPFGPCLFEKRERELKIDGGRRDDPQQLKKGSHSFRQRLLLWTLSSTPIIRQRLNPSLQHHEMSLLRLFETVSDDCVTLALIQIKLTDVTDPMVNEKVADRVGEDLEGVTHKVYFDIQINGSPE